MSLLTVGPPSQAQLDFQTAMQDRIRAGLGDLMPDEVLRDIVKRGVEECFFARRLLPARNSWEQPQPAEPWIVEFLSNELRSRCHDALKDWVATHEDVIKAMIEQMFAKSVGQVILDSFSSLFTSEFRKFQQGLMDTIRQLTNR